MACAATASPLSLMANTFVDALRAAGYRTALVGKSHLQNFTGTRPFCSGRRRGRATPSRRAEFAEALKPAVRGGDYGQEHPSRWEPGADYDLSCRSTALSMSISARLTAISSAGTTTHWLKKQRPDADALRGPQQPVAARLRLSAGFPHRRSGGALSNELHCREVLRLAGWLRAKRRRQAVLPDDLVSRPAPPVHAARALLGHVLARRHDPAAELRLRQPPAPPPGGLGVGTARKRQAPTPANRRRSRSTSARRARRWR